MHYMKILFLTCILMANNFSFAAINEGQWKKPIVRVCMGMSYIVNGGSNNINVSATFDDNSEITPFTIKAKSNYKLSFVKQKNGTKNLFNKKVYLVITNASNGEQLFSGFIEECENLIIAGPVSVFYNEISLPGAP